MDAHNDSWLAADFSLDVALRKTLGGPAGNFDLQVDVQVEPGSFVMLTGASGTGKTTFLRLLAGFERPQAGRIRGGGRIWYDGRTKAFVPACRRPVGFVFQDYALFPNMTVLGNVAYALGRRADRTEAMRLLAPVGLDGLADVFPARLSGGQKQRLALVRALARRPRVLLLDEPLSALDPEMRGELREELLRLHRRYGTTTIMVSHDHAEIAQMADRVLRLAAGKVAFDGPPDRTFAAAPGGIRARGMVLAPPDVRGEAIILLNGTPVRLPLPGANPLRPGQEVELDLSAVAVRPA